MTVVIKPMPCQVPGHRNVAPQTVINFSNLCKHCLVAPDSTIRDGLRALDAGAIRIAFVVEDGGRLAGLVTDGDMRRALLKGADLDSPLLEHATRSFLSVDTKAGRAEVLELMQSRGIQHAPVVDSSNRLVGVHLMGELVSRQARPNVALLLAGGRGTRLWPLTEDIPKPMLRVAGRPILERLLLHVLGFGIRRLYFSVNYLAEQIHSYFGDGSRFGCEINYLHERMPLGTGGPLSLIKETLHEPLLVLNGDLVTQTNLGQLLDFHSEAGYAMTIGVRMYQLQIPFGCLEVNQGRVVSLDEKPTFCRPINAGIYAIEPALLRQVPRDTLFPITSLVQMALTSGSPVGAFEIQDDWMDIGHKEQLAVAQEGGR